MAMSDGKSGPQDLVIAFNTHMKIINMNDSLKCKLWNLEGSDYALVYEFSQNLLNQLPRPLQKTNSLILGKQILQDFHHGTLQCKEGEL